MIQFPELRIIGVPGLPEIAAGDDLPSLIARAARDASIEISEGDILVVAPFSSHQSSLRTWRASGPKLTAKTRA